ncbi:MAG: HDOD domain-containing protein [Phycisphaerales bacterium]|nr:HDOD domain-containing protein [Phycisphaerales bacterium]
MNDKAFNDVLNCPSLPSLPAVAAKLIELTGDPNVQMSEIAKTVQQDQALAGKVLKTVNSSYYGLPNRCGSIDRAMGYLGLNTVKSLVLGFSLVECTNQSDNEGFDLVSHWRRTLMGATASRTLAQMFRLSDKDEVFTAALFQDMGMLANFTALKDQYLGVISGIEHGNVSDREQDELGFTHSKMGAELARKWSLPDNIADAIEFHHAPDRANDGDIEMIRAVSLGTQVAEALCVENPKAAIRKIESKTREWFPKQQIDIEELFEEVNESSKELASLFNTEIGEVKDVQTLMAQAQDRGLEHQISMQRQTENLEREAFTDGLTQIPNRKEFDKLINTAYSSQMSSGTPFAVLFFDADKFKSVNDTHGHAVGDAVLIELANRTTKTVGSEGTVCRYGGEEFGVILPGYGTIKAAMMAERVRSEIASTPFDIRNCDEGPDELPVTVSIGVSAVDSGPADRLTKPEQIVSEADEGVYAAKAAGRNNVQVWSPSGIGVKQAPSQPDTAGSVTQSESSDIVIPEGDGVVREILLVEDDAMAATLLITLLSRKTDIKVRWLKSGDEAIELFKMSIQDQTRPADVVVCDLNLPCVNGFDVYRSFAGHGLNRQLPFFLLTAHAPEEIEAEATALGITQCVTKMDFTKNLGKWIKELTKPTELTKAA